jgi:adenylylsulfate kinase
MIIWLTGQPGSGKTTIAEKLWRTQVCDDLVDGDHLRHLLPNPGYAESGRRRNVDRAQGIAAYLANKGRWVAVALVAPYRDQRELLKQSSHNVLEVYLHYDPELVGTRGKEQYWVAEYEPPEENFVDIDTGALSVKETVLAIHRALSALS